MEWCSNSGSSVQFTANVIGGTAPYVFDWTPKTNISPSNTQIVTVNPQSAGAYTYTVNITDAKGCIISASASVTVNATPNSFSINGGGNYCSGGVGVDVGLSGSQLNVSYQLVRDGAINVGSPLTGTGNALSFGYQTTAGTYTVKATSVPQGCVAIMSGSVPVIVDALPTADAGVDKSIVACSSDSIQLGGSPTATFNGVSCSTCTYSWAPNTSLSSSSIANPWVKNLGATTTYTVTVSTTSGCTAQDAVIVTVNNSSLSVGISANSTRTWCANSGSSAQFTANVTGGTAPFTYSWTGSALSSFSTQIVTASPQVSGTYIYAVVVTDAHGCQASASDTIIVNPLPVIYNVTGGGSYCQNAGGLDVSLSNSEIGVSYQLILNGTNIGAPVVGTGGSISFGNQIEV